MARDPRNASLMEPCSQRSAARPPMATILRVPRGNRPASTNTFANGVRRTSVCRLLADFHGQRRALGFLEQSRVAFEFVQVIAATLPHLVTSRQVTFLFNFLCHLWVHSAGRWSNFLTHRFVIWTHTTFARLINSSWNYVLSFAVFVMADSRNLFWWDWFGFGWRLLHLASKSPASTVYSICVHVFILEYQQFLCH